MADMKQSQQIDVDELAKEKVQEIEQSLNASENHKLLIVDQWFTILKQIITAADLHRTNDKEKNRDANDESKVETDESIYADYADDNERFNAVDLTEQFATNPVKWTIRVKAFKLVHRLVHMLIQPGKSATTKIPLLKHLSDLIRLAFVAATSPYDDLKTQGFEMFKFLIKRFASVEEREFPGVSILYQYRTQVLSALKPAFNLDAPPYITAIASQVCCLWICHGFEKDAINLKRTYQLMLASINKLENQSINQNSKLYTEYELEQERLDILGSWAQLYITAKECDELLPTSLKNSRMAGFDSKHLDELVKNNISSLINRWWEALKDYALLIMPASRISGTLHEHENVYTRDVALRLFGPVWPKIILATTIWLWSDDFEKHSKNPETTSNGEKETCEESRRIKYSKFICGIIMKELCSCNSDKEKDFLPESTLIVVKSLSILVNNYDVMSALMEDLTVTQEFYTIIYSIMINRTKANNQYHLFMRNLLDHIFTMVAKRVASNPDCIKSSLVFLTNDLKADIEGLNSISNVEKFPTNELLRTNLLLRLSNTINIMKLVPEGEDLDQYDSLTEVFQLVLANENDVSVGIALLDLLKHFYTTAPLSIIHKFTGTLFMTKKAVVSKLLCTFGNRENLGRDRLVQCLAHLDAYLKSMRDDISLFDENDNLIRTYVEVLLENFPLPNMSNQSTTTLIRKKDLLDICLRNIKELDILFHDRFESIMIDDIRKVYDSALGLQQDLRSEADLKRNSMLTKKSTGVMPAKTPVRITLKADFSNFYAKKS